MSPNNDKKVKAQWTVQKDESKSQAKKSPNKKGRTESMDAFADLIGSPIKAQKQPELRDDVRETTNRMDRMEDMLSKMMGMMEVNAQAVQGFTPTIQALQGQVEMLKAEVKKTQQESILVLDELARSKALWRGRHLGVPEVQNGANVGLGKPATLQQVGLGSPAIGNGIDLGSPAMGNGARMGAPAASVNVRSGGAVSASGSSSLDVSMETSMPDLKEMKFSMEKFVGEEIYRGLGYGFESWREIFLERLEFAQLQSGKKWPESAKLMKLVDSLGTKMQQHVQTNNSLWKREYGGELSLDFVLQKLEVDFGTNVPEDRLLERMREPKAANMTWQEHMSFLQFMNHVAGGKCDVMVLKNIVEYANPSLKPILMGKFNERSVDKVAEAKRMVNFIEAYLEPSGGRVRKSTVNAVTSEEENPMKGKCFHCGEEGHYKRRCPRLQGSGGEQAESQRHCHAISWNF